MSWLKKGPLLGLLGGLLALWGLAFFLFDRLLERAIVSGGQAAAGAKVELGSLRTRWRSATLELRSLSVADKEAPMRNVLELSRASFQLDGSALLRGKVVVREAAIEGIRSGTPRKSSGALPEPPEPSALERMIKDKLAPKSAAPLAVKERAAAEVDAAKLSGLKKLDEAKAKAREIEARWKGKAEELRTIESEARELQEEAKALSGGGDFLKKAQAAASVQKKAKELIARVEAQKEQARQDLSQAQALLREADELRKKDVSGLMAEAGLPSLDSGELSRRLLGAQTASRLTSALRWMRWAREKAAARKAAVPPKPPRRKGVDVEFPVARAYPQFLLENARLSGELELAGGPLALSGRLDGVTSNPALYGKPATLELSGRDARGVSLSLLGALAQQSEPVGISLRFDAAGLPIAGAALGDGEVGGTLSSGLAALRGTISSNGEQWQGGARVEAAKVAIEPKVSLPAPAGALVSEALRGLSGFHVDVSIAGREDDLQLAFASNVGDAASGAMRKALSAQLDAQRKALEAKVNALYQDKYNDARAQVDALGPKLLGPLDKQREGLERQLRDAVGRSAPRLDKLFR